MSALRFNYFYIRKVILRNRRTSFITSRARNVSAYAQRIKKYVCTGVFTYMSMYAQIPLTADSSLVAKEYE